MYVISWNNFQEGSEQSQSIESLIIQYKVQISDRGFNDVKTAVYPSIALYFLMHLVDFLPKHEASLSHFFFPVPSQVQLVSK